MTIRHFSIMKIAVISVLLSLGACDNSTSTDQAAQKPEAKQNETSIVGNITDERIINHDGEPNNWMSYGLGYEEQRFSPLKKINKNTIKKLSEKLHAKKFKFRNLKTKRGTEAEGDKNSWIRRKKLFSFFPLPLPSFRERRAGRSRADRPLHGTHFFGREAE